MVNYMLKYFVNLVALHITEVCTHKCPMCYMSDENTPKSPKSYPISKLKRVVDELADNQVREISLLGGDPAKHPDILELIKYINENGIIVSSLSNTHEYMNADFFKIIKYIDNFETTFHHYIPELHDDFCGSKGAFINSVNKLLEANRYNKKVGIALNITPDTADIIYNIIEVLLTNYKLKLDYIIIQRIIPFGRAASTSEFTLSREQVVNAIYQLKKVKNTFNISFVIEDPVPLCILPTDLREFVIPCQWGLTKVSLNGNGDVSRCGADPRYRLGNIFEESLLKIWNESDLLKSFREKQYLPGRCQVCEDREQCGGGCPLSCELEKDHGLDYLYLEYEKIDKKIHGKLTFRSANPDELSSILQIEWGNFSGYGHIFSVNSLKKWYSHNPDMFKVVLDERNWILAYAVVVPITKSLFDQLHQGKCSAISDFPKLEVLKEMNSPYYHIEVIATIPAKYSSRAGSYLIKSVGLFLIENAKHVTTSPVLSIGLRLCKHFGFEHIADEKWMDQLYPIYNLNVDKEKIKYKLKLF